MCTWYSCVYVYLISLIILCFFLFSLSVSLFMQFYSIHSEHTGSHQGPHEKRLLNNLLSNYNTLERPVSNESDALTVKFGLTLQQIIDVVCFAQRAHAQINYILNSTYTRNSFLNFLFSFSMTIFVCGGPLSVPHRRWGNVKENKTSVKHAVKIYSRKMTKK